MTVHRNSNSSGSSVSKKIVTKQVTKRLLMLTVLAVCISTATANSLPFLTKPVKLESPVIIYSADGAMDIGTQSGFLIINFWATWCSPCIREIPSLAVLDGKLSNARVLFLNMGNESLEVADEFLNRLGVEYSSYVDRDKNATEMLPMRGLPTTYILGPEGMVYTRVEGYIDWEDTGVYKQLKTLTEEPNS